MLMTLTLVVLSSQQMHVPENRYETCSLKLNRGDTCCSTPNNTIRFYFDVELAQCFSYLYEGCGGGRNTFYNEEDCHFTCIPADKHTCGGNKQPTGSCHDLDLSCPMGSSCKEGFGGGLCCEDINEKEWQRETNPVCQIGNVLRRAVWYGSKVWIGKSCTHRFCPHRYRCVQGKRVAHCCGPIPNFKEKHRGRSDNTIDCEDNQDEKKKIANHKTDDSSSSSSEEQISIGEFEKKLTPSCLC